MASINETIATITKEYLNPKYPIYKIDSVHSDIIFDDDNITIQSRREIRLWEVDDDYNYTTTGRDADQYNYPKKRCSSKYIEMCIKNINDYSAITYGNSEAIKVISCERIA